MGTRDVWSQSESPAVKRGKTGDIPTGNDSLVSPGFLILSLAVLTIFIIVMGLFILGVFWLLLFFS